MVSRRRNDLVKATALALAFALLLLPTAAKAQGAPPQPEDDPRAVEARKACAAGEVEKGVKLLADYLASSDDVTAIYNIGRCYQQNGLTEKALLQFREYLRKAKELTPDERSDAEAQVKELENARAPTAIPTTRAGDADRPVLRRVGLVMGGAGIAALAAGAIFGLKVLGKNDDLAAERRRPEDDPPPAGRYTQLMDEAHSAQTFHRVFLGLGAAALAGGTACYLLGRASGHERQVVIAPWIAPGGAGGHVAMRF